MSRGRALHVATAARSLITSKRAGADQGISSWRQLTEWSIRSPQLGYEACRSTNTMTLADDCSRECPLLAQDCRRRRSTRHGRCPGISCVRVQSSPQQAPPACVSIISQLLVAARTGAPEAKLTGLESPDHYPVEAVLSPANSDPPSEH
jgi:hypothetical protein